MKNLRIALLLLVIPLLAFTMVHKYYISVTQVEYIKQKESLQITSRIFIDDFEKLLRERYDDKITLDVKDEISTVEMYIERYLIEKLQIEINDKPVILKYLGKEYEDDVVFCYIEIEGIKEIKSFQISNKILMDLFEEQENIIRTNINGKNKSFILTKENDKAMLNFN